MKFSEIGLHPLLLEAISSMGFEEATPIQSEAIPEAIAGSDVLGCAQTGTGKTASFVIPVLDGILKTESQGKLSAIIIAPTRELALQIDQQIEGLSYFTGISSASIYGGGTAYDFDMEKKAFTSGVEVIVATPGRLKSHFNLGYTKTEDLKFFVLDEADRMLDMGFVDDIMKIHRELPLKKQTFLFSATMPTRIKQLAKDLLVHPKEISIAVSKTAAGIDQQAVMVYDHHKLKVVLDIVQKCDYKSVIIFCSTKQETKRVSAEMQKRGLSAKSFHSDLEQEERERRMLNFKNRETQTLIGTDIISRGIDVEDIDLVINYSVPGDPEDYVHRVGRTARAASTGKAITFINDYEQYKFKRIEELIGKEIPKSKPAEGLGEGPDYDPNKKARKPGGGFNRSKNNNKRRWNNRKK